MSFLVTASHCYTASSRHVLTVKRSARSLSQPPIVGHNASVGKKNRRNRQQSSARATAAAEAPTLSPEEQAARRAQQKREWAEQKRGKERAASGSIAPLVW